MEMMAAMAGSKADPVRTKIFRALGTTNTIQAYGARANDALERAARRVLELDDRLSVFKPRATLRGSTLARERPVPFSRTRCACSRR
jgi:hypothetical protein